MALAGEVDPRERLIEGDGDEGVGLVVAQADVEAGPVLLDEALLRQQGLGLARDDEELDLLDARDHLGVPRGALGLGLGEVGGDPLADGLGLAHVEDPALPVQEQVDPRLVREDPPLLREGSCARTGDDGRRRSGRGLGGAVGLGFAQDLGRSGLAQGLIVGVSRARSVLDVSIEDRSRPGAGPRSRRGGAGGERRPGAGVSRSTKGRPRAHTRVS